MADCYVQHVSGQGKIYKVFYEGQSSWQVNDPGHGMLFFLPKDEYVVCEPPEQWDDVTSQCEVDGVRIYIPGLHHHDYIDTAFHFTGVKYRLRWSITRDNAKCFTVERLRQP